MISRRLLRLKMMQILYAYFQSEDKNIAKFEKELTHSIDKSYELYHLFLILLLDLKQYAESRIELGKSKRLPGTDDLNPNLRFLNNRVFNQISNNIQLQSYCKSHPVSWVNYPEFVKNIYLKLIDSEHFKIYMSAPKCSYKDDKALLVYILNYLLPESDDLLPILEEQSIYWTDEVEFVIGMVSRTIGDFKESHGDNAPLMPLFKNDDDRDFMKRLFRKSVISDAEFTKLIKQHSDNWEIERIAFMDIVLMKMALSEIIEFPSIPIKVSMNEYIELSKYYSTEKSSVFINGLLDKIITDLTKQNQISKSGSGLISNKIK